MKASWTNYGEEDNSTLIYATGGVMKIFASPEHSIEIVKASGERDYYDVEKIQTNDSQTSSGVIDAFVRSLKARRAEISADDVLRSMEAVFAAIRSSEERREVEL